MNERYGSQRRKVPPSPSKRILRPGGADGLLISRGQVSIGGIVGLRKIETGLAWFTVGALVVYFPVETWVSWKDGLWNPFYVVDLIAMLLLGWGAVRSLRARPGSAPSVLCAAFAWSAANGWRATFGRMFELLEGATLDNGAVEMWFVSIGTAIALACLILSLYLVVRSNK
jgi:hypothetical protein